VVAVGLAVVMVFCLVSFSMLFCGVVDIIKAHNFRGRSVFCVFVVVGA
jgi:hypothetical protein